MDIIEMVKRLVSTPGEIGRTAEVEELAASFLDRVPGAEIEIQAVPGHGNNVIARVFHDPSYPTILINGHLDTVEVCSGWEREPFQPVIEGDRLYGLGSADMQAGIAIGIEAFRMLAGLENVNVIFAGTVDEEGDSTGAFALLDNGIEADLCLIPEPTSGSLMMGCRGRLVFQVEVRGSSAHGAKPETGVNAITEASKFVCVLDKLPISGHDVLPPGSFCVLEFQGGTGTLSVPDSARLKLDRHYVPGETVEKMLADLERAAVELNSPGDFDIGLWPHRKTPFLEPYITDNSGLAREFCEFVGGKVSYGKSVGDYNAFARRMPVVVYGPEGGNWHAADEWVSISSVRETLAGYGRFIGHLSRKTL